MKKIMFLFGILFSVSSTAQVFVIEDGVTINSCTGLFVDSGGETGSYSGNESFTYIICPENAGQFVKLNFSAFATQAGADVMTIYNADNALDPTTSFGQFSGETAANSPGFVSATQANITGCLTIVFTSSGGVNKAGWVADISCFEPCQTIISVLDSASPASNPDGYIQVCPNEDITLTGSGQFSSSGAGATYEWDLGDGTTQVGQTAVFSYDTPGVYIVNLNIRDSNTSIDPEGCTNANLINQVIQVGTVPDFVGTVALQDAICFGDSTTIEGVITPALFINDCTPPVSELTPLPDGNGIPYKTCITVDCYDSDLTLDTIDELLDICMNIEHSYLGDLEIIITSPNGQSATLHGFPGGGGTYLGAPNDDPSNTQGVGADYCFSASGTTLLENGATVQAGNPRSDSIAPGTYLPDDSFAQLIGSPLNGEWCITIIDNLGQDDGYIFSWGLNFDPNLQPPELSFTPTIVSEAWDADSSITNTNTNTITVQPTSSGVSCYTYRATDDFGCEYTEEVCIDVIPEIVYAAADNLFECNTGTAVGVFDLTENDAIISGPTTNPTDFVLKYYETELEADAGSNPISATDAIAFSGTDGQIIYARFEYQTSGCYETVSFTLNLVDQPLIFPVTDIITCDDISNDGSEPFDLSERTLDILGGQLFANYTVSYYATFADANAGANGLSVPYTNISSPQPIYVRVEANGGAGCYIVDPNPVFNLVVNHKVTASGLSPIPTCDDDSDGKMPFNLEQQTTVVLGSQLPSDFRVTYHETQAEANSNSNPLTSPFTNTTVDRQTIFVRVEEIGLESCYETTQFDIIVDPLPHLTAPMPLEVCDDGTPDGVTQIDLTEKDDEISGGNMDYAITYYLDQNDANIGTNPLSIPYTNISTSQIIFARGEDINTGCFSTIDLELKVLPSPSANTPTELPICDPESDGFGDFKLTDRDLEISGGVSGVTVSYHETLSDAENEINPLASPYTNTQINTQIVFARVENPSISTLCATIVELVLVVNPTPQLIDPIPLQICDDDTDQFVQFDLTEKAAEFLNAVPAADVSISYYETQLDAENKTLEIGTPTDYRNLSNPQTIWIRVAYNGTGCEKLTSLELIVNPLPVFLNPSLLPLCDNNAPGDGREAFTLEDRTAEILNGQTGLDVSYFLNLLDAEANSSALTSPYTNINNPQTVFVRVTNPATSCYDFTTLTLEVLPIPTPNILTPMHDLYECENNTSGSGQGVFNLTDNEVFILNGEVGVIPTYYETLIDAEEATNPIQFPANYTNTAIPLQTIYVRVTNDTTNCFAIVDFDVIVTPLPDVVPNSALIVCELNTDGKYAFDLEAQSDLIRGTQSASTFLVTYHESASDAIDRVNPLASPYTNTSNPQTIYVNVTNTITNCQNTTLDFNLEVLEAAQATSPSTPFTICDDNVEADTDPTNDSVEFDLTSLDASVLNGQDPSNYVVSYFATQIDADLDQFELPSFYQNEVNPQEIFARVDNNTQVISQTGTLVDSSVCYETAPVILKVNPLPYIDIDDEYVICVDTNGTEVVGALEITTGLSDFNYIFIWKDDTGTIVETASSYVPTVSGIYTLEVFDALSATQCAAPIEVFTVIESSPPTVSAVVTTKAFASTHIIQATATGLGNYEYNIDQGPWQDTGVFVGVNPGERVVNVRDLNGCGVGQAIVYVIDYPKYFTPNGDGYHDSWNIAGVSDQFNAKIQIFDRYGKLLKEIRPSSDGWDGTYNGASLPSSDYWFIMSYNDPITGKSKLLNAHFSLKR
ncbi:T9SS type B sorting domain-containing protein [Flavobacteriaceae bacterium]|nr:T9SS type B sorting domain-containing protein [Flavobacteriaceae bacterium]